MTSNHKVLIFQSSLLANWKQTSPFWSVAIGPYLQVKCSLEACMADNQQQLNSGVQDNGSSASQSKSHN